ncbi:tail fiber [Erwinia phage Orgeat]|nr:tail fiber [Erwinia phage Orgeat]
MASRKEMMGMDTETLRMLGLEAGLSFEPGLSKSKMVIQLETHQASGWLDVNSQLLHADAEGGFDHMQGFTGHEEQSISDAARVAQSLAGAGYTETFHSIMGGGRDHHVDALHQYMQKLGVSADDVWMHMPKANPNIPPQNFNMLKGYLNNHWDDYQDIMPPLEGHYAGDIMGEYSTNKGNVADSYNHLASMYLNKAAYNNPHAYEHDAALVATRLASAMGNQFLEVGYAAATGAKVGYHSILPQLGSDVVRGTQYPREPLNAAGLPLGATGSAVQGNRAHYSLVASLLGRPEGADEASSAIRQEVSSTMKSLASSYKGGGETGMNPYRHETSEHDLLLDSATRYVGIEEARSGYANLDDTSYNRNNIQAVIENSWDKMDAQAASAPSGVPNPDLRLPRRAEIGTQWSADLNEPLSWNSARSRRESIAIADLDAAHANFRDVADGSRGSSPVHFHNMEQGSDEWFKFREQYDITGSTVGGFLGSNSYTRPWAQFMDKLGVTRKDTAPNEFQEKMFAMGHQRENEARIRVSKQLGQDIQQVGAITNDMYPGMMYSPDGLIGDDALWEHKAPERAGKFADLSAGEHPDYMDQIQMGMLLSGRKKTLFSQTIGQETRNQWIDQDPDWYSKNQARLDSVLNRMQAGRDFLSNHADLPQDELKAGVRKAVTGEGIWKDVRQKSDRGYSPNAGTEADPFLIGGRRSYNDAAQGGSDYEPNFVTSANTGLVPVGGNGAETGMALAVKQGVLAAREEVKRGEASGNAAGFDAGGADADFDDLGMPRGFSRKAFDRANSDGAGGGGGDGGRRNGTGGGAFDNFGNGIASGLASGSLHGLQGGFQRELANMGPVGQTLLAGIGAASIGGEVISTMNDYLGNAQDFGSSNPIQFDAQQQGMEMLGLNKAQAQRANETVHSAFNMMANGDPSAAAQMSVATRGLITLADIRESGGDPIKLNRIFVERARSRGWSQERIAGAAQMAGLDGFARTASTSERIRNAAEGLDDTRGRQDTSEFAGAVREDNATRAAVSPDYFVQRYGAQDYNALVGGLSGGMSKAYQLMDKAEQVTHAKSLAEATQMLESGGRDYDDKGNPLTSSTGAKYSMQVLPSTARDPGYGVKPAQSDTPEEYNRVGRELLDKMVGKYAGDYDKAAAAYTDGAGTVDRAVKQWGNDWLKHMPAQAQKRVADLHKLATGANGFAGGSTGPSVGTIQVNVTATVNGKQATATANVGNQSQSHTINVGGAVSQKR